MLGLIPFLLALTIAEQAARGERTGQPALELLPWVAAIILAWWLLCEGIGWALARHPRPRLLELWDQGGEYLALLAYAGIVLGLGWGAQWHIYSLAILPWLLLQGLQWFALAPALRRLGSSWSRPGLLWHRLRFAIVPVALLLPILDVCDALARTELLAPVFSSPLGTVLNGLGAVLVMVGMVTVMPMALVRIWGCRDLPAGEHRSFLADCCASAGIRGRLLNWPSPGGRLYNAAVLGVLPRHRYVLFSDDLLRDLPPDELRAVIGHELGHVRHGHLQLFVLLFLALGGAFYVLAPVCVDLAAGAPLLRDLPADIRALIVYIALFLVKFRLIFGVVSRACERQADLAGAGLAGQGDFARGCGHMCAALKSVACLSGTREDAPSWRHHSIAQRVAFLQRAAASPPLATAHHDRLRSMRYALLLLVFGMALSLAAQILLDPLRPARQAADPVAELQTFTADRPPLYKALRQADQGDPGPLGNWLSRASPIERQRLGVLMLRQFSEARNGVEADIREAWKARFRLQPFTRIPTEDARLDLDLDNLIAYTLVAGVDMPGPADLATARSILGRLERAMAISPEHAIWDTIGCIRFRIGEHELARQAFSRALDLLAEEKLPPEAAFQALKSRTESLYRRRQDAAGASAVPGARPLPLPLDWDAVQPEAPRPSASAAPAARPGASGARPR